MRRGSALLEKRTQVEGYVFVGLNAVWDQKARRMERNVNVALEYRRHAQFISKGAHDGDYQFFSTLSCLSADCRVHAEMPRLVDVNAGSKQGYFLSV